MTTLADIELACPVCETRFRSRRINSHSSYGQDTDFRPRALGLDPQPYYVHVCPTCMFAAFELDYQNLQDSVRDHVLGGDYHPHEDITQADAEGLTGSTKYLLAARCYAYDPRASDLRLADLFLRASWCARQENLPERERETQCQSALLFEKAVDAGEVADDQTVTMMYLIGELYRRIGRFELAEAVLERAAASLGEDQEDERLAGLIARQCAAAREHDFGNMTIGDALT
jgi:uncharacterized protein